MSAGDVHSEPITEYRDPVTGRRVRRLTDLATHCHHPYFYYRAFTPDGSKVLYVSHRTGRPCAYLLELATGRSVQLAELDGQSGFLMCLTGDGRHLLYAKGPRLHRLSLDAHAGGRTGAFKDEVVWEQRPPWDGGSVYPGYGEGQRTALLAQMHRDDVVPNTGGWDFLVPQWEAHPRCRLVLVDLAGGADVVLEEACWLGHPQIRPGDPDTLMYCHEGPEDRIDARIWLIRPDGSDKRPVGLYEPDPTVHRPYVTHEYFTPDGQFIAYVVFPRQGGRDGTIRLLRLATLEETNLGAVRNYCHFSHSPDGRWIVGDEMNSEHKDRAGIWLFDIARRLERPLCLHGSSFAPRGTSTQDAHPHPCFFPDGRSVLFTSDRETSPTGPCAVYLADADGVFD